MRKNDLLFMVLIIFIMIGSIGLIISCERQMLDYERDALISRNNQIKEEIENNKQILELLSILPDNAYYLITLEIRQSTFSLDIGQNIKNRINSIEFTIPVSKEFYASVDIGTKLNNTFKWGSFVFDGDFSKLNVTIKNKRMERP